MKKIKIVGILLATFLLSACSVTYNIDINKLYGCSEKATIIDFSEEISGISYDEFVKEVNSIGNYKIDGSNPNNILINSEKCDLNKLTKKGLLSDYITSFEIGRKSTEIVFDEEKFSYLFTYYEEDEKISTGLVVTVNMTVPFEVTEHNANEVNGNTYTWVFNKYIESPHIYIKYEDAKEASQKWGSTILYIAAGILGVLALIVIFGIIIKSKNANKI